MCACFAQELAEAKARAELKQAKANALWRQHQAKPAHTGPLLRSVMGDRGVFGRLCPWEGYRWV